MNYLECRIGNEDIFIPCSDELQKVIIKTNRKVNHSKRLAKMRKVYYGEIYDDLIIFSPTFLFALEDSLGEFGYKDIFHETFLEFTSHERYMLFALLRDGKSFRFLLQNWKIHFEIALSVIQALFAKISNKIIFQGEK